jgi:ATP-dependent protease ClpP protease subunit/transposase-like protein
MSQHFLLSSAARSLTLAQVMRLSDGEAEEMFRRIRRAENHDQPVCPHCGSVTVYDCRRPNGAPRWRCKGCKADFSVTSGTIFAFHKLPLRGYLAAIAIFCNEVKGKSALALSRDLGVQYKTSFVLQHKLREAMASEMKGVRLGGDGKEASIDGAYFGGYVKPANLRENRRDRTIRSSVVIPFPGFSVVPRRSIGNQQRPDARLTFPRIATLWEGPTMRAFAAMLMLSFVAMLPPAEARVVVECNEKTEKICFFYSIDITGRIDQQTVNDFRAAVVDPHIANQRQFDTNSVSVRLNSPGGSVLDAMAIGEAVRAANMMTGVYVHSECSSACVLVLAAGVRRDAIGGTVAIHRPHFEESYFASMSQKQAREKYEQMSQNVRQYLARMGMSDDLYRAMLKVPSDELRVLSSTNAQSYGLDGEDAAWIEWVRAKAIERDGRENYELNKSLNNTLSVCANAGHAFDKCDLDIRRPFLQDANTCAEKQSTDNVVACFKTVERRMSGKYRP